MFYFPGLGHFGCEAQHGFRIFPCCNIPLPATRASSDRLAGIINEVSIEHDMLSTWVSL